MNHQSAGKLHRNFTSVMRVHIRQVLITSKQVFARGRAINVGCHAGLQSGDVTAPQAFREVEAGMGGCPMRVLRVPLKLRAGQCPLNLPCVNV